MIQSLEKAFRIIEHQAAEPEEPMSLGSIASSLGLNKATCSHILKTLVSLNYAEQMGPRQGYRLGPMAYSLTRQGPYRKDLVAVAEPLVTQLAAEVRETVLVSTLSRGTRFTLCQVDGTRDVQVKAQPMATANVYETATGRLLLAHLGSKELAAFVRENGLPGTRWSEVDGEEALGAVLVTLRKAQVVAHVTPHQVVGLACPIREGERVVAALGLFLPEYRFVGEHKEAILRGMRRTAERISSRVSAPAQSDAAGGDEEGQG